MPLAADDDQERAVLCAVAQRRYGATLPAIVSNPRSVSGNRTLESVAPLLHGSRLPLTTHASVFSAYAFAVPARALYRKNSDQDQDTTENG